MKANVILEPIVAEDEDIDDFTLWSNDIGEFYHGETPIQEEELPEELRKANQNLSDILWSRNPNDTGLLGEAFLGNCYLLEYKGEYKVAIQTSFTEIDTKYHDNNGGKSFEDLLDQCDEPYEELFRYIKYRMQKFAENPAFNDSIILTYDIYGENYDLIVMFPCDIPKEQFAEALRIVWETAYNVDEFYKGNYDIYD